MADETILIDIEYNTDEAQASIEQLSSTIEANRVEQARLREEYRNGEISSTRYSEQTARLRTQVQRENQQRRGLIRLLQTEQGSRNRLRQTIAQLTRERDNLNMSTREGRQRSEELRRQIDEMNESLRESGTASQQQTMNIGNYASALEGMAPGIMGFVQGMGQMTKAALKFIATPIGAVLAAITAAIALLVKAFNRSEGNINKLRVITGKLTGAFNGLLKMLEPVVAFLLDHVIVAFDTLGKIADKTVGLVARGLEKLGFEKAAESVEEFGNKMQEAATQGEELAAAQNELNNALRFAEKIQLDFQKLAEEQRQIRDDEARSVEERIVANEKLGEILQKQLAEELKIANKQLEVANMRIALEGDTTAALDERAEALTRISDIQERIAGQESEQLVNINSLIKEQNDLRAERQRLIDEEVQKALEQEEKIAEESIDAELERIEDSLAAEFDANKKTADAITDLYEEAEKLRTANSEKEAAKRKEIFENSVNFIAQTSQSLGGLLTTINQNRLNQELKAAGDNDREKEKIERKFARRNKRIAQAQAAINGALAVTKILAEVPKVDFGISTGILIAAAVATTAAQIATIQATKFGNGGRVPLAKRGAKFGKFRGASHSSGGIDLFTGSGKHVANVEHDENFYVINKKASSYINSLSDINQRIGGGVPLSRTSRKMQDGGQLDTQSTTQQGMNINDITTEVVRRLPPIIVKTEDIKTGLTDRENVINAGVVG